jgi:alanine racemase
VGIFSHLSNVRRRRPRRDRALHDGLALAASHGLAPQLRHIAASHAAIALPESRFGCVRLGIAIYGLSPFADRTSADLGLRPAMTLRAPSRRSGACPPARASRTATATARRRRPRSP